MPNALSAGRAREKAEAAAAAADADDGGQVGLVGQVGQVGQVGRAGKSDVLNYPLPPPLLALPGPPAYPAHTTPVPRTRASRCGP